jgi:SOS-response transcriptional repressor LexA
MVEPRHRLQQARAEAGYASPSDAARALRDINKNTLISHENGNRPLSRKAAEKYGRLFKVDPGWLLFDGDRFGGDHAGGGFREAGQAALAASPLTVDIPIVSWISAGELGGQDGVVDLSDYPTIPAADLEEGEWIALRVDGPSMNKISPPDSIIFVNLRDKRLVTNGCYVISDESGRATYKRWRPNDSPPFQPASYLDIPPPELEGAITIIGRVKRSMIDM